MQLHLPGPQSTCMYAPSCMQDPSCSHAPPRVAMDVPPILQPCPPPRVAMVAHSSCMCSHRWLISRATGVMVAMDNHMLLHACMHTCELVIMRYSVLFPSSHLFLFPTQAQSFLTTTHYTHASFLGKTLHVGSSTLCWAFLGDVCV